ncbi:MAG: 4Fe-4S dicluster domain-containing protein [Coriobacteriaceae bacterium]|jgi:Fe-S-cluster-containing dehydrogenase component|nr:4Fe-4S dicluster domain-containing protein [Coriobacteriaceae bacterium]
MTKYGFAINLHRCIGCRTCTISCKMENLSPEGVQRIRVLNPEDEVIYDRPKGTYPKLTMTWTPVPCQHCETPPCVIVCPVAATEKRPDGIVTIDKEKCTGCRSCVTACPYGARQFDPEALKADKCTLCLHRLDAGLEKTVCQMSCPGRAIVVGDSEDDTSELARIIRENKTSLLFEEEGTGPQVYYWDSVKG